MKFNQKKYVDNYNKNNYKMYQFRVKKNSDTIEYLNNIGNKNKYIVDLIEKDKNVGVLSLPEIKKIVKPVLNKYGITDINIFGSYARGEANKNSDIDIYCDKGNIKNLIDQGKMEDELEKALNKKVDVIFNSSKMDSFFESQIREDMIKLSWK